MKGWKKYALITMLSFLLSFVIVSNASPEPGFLGVNYEPVTKDFAKDKKLSIDYGVYVTSVIKGTAAEKAGLKAGDVIIKIDGDKIDDGSLFAKMIAEAEAGEEVLLEVVRNGKTLNLKAKLGARKKGEFGSFDFTIFNHDDDDVLFLKGAHYNLHLTSLSGMLLFPMKAELATYFKSKDGFLVLQVRDKSEAKKAGIKAGDVVIMLNKKPVKNKKDLEKLLGKMSDTDKVGVVVVRNGKKHKKNLKLAIDGTAIFIASSTGKPFSKIFISEEAKKKAEKLRVKALKWAKEHELKNELMRKEGIEKIYSVKIDSLKEKEKYLKKMEEKLKQLEQKLQKLEQKLYEKKKKEK